MCVPIYGPYAEMLLKKVTCPGELGFVFAVNLSVL